MKKWMIGLLACLVMLMGCAQAQVLTTAAGTAEVLPSDLDGESWLFLPSFAELSALYPDAYAYDEEEAPGVWYDDESETFLMQGGNLRSLFLFSADPLEHGRQWVEASKTHDNETTGSYALVDVDGNVDHSGDLRQIRGRGNYTWGQAKKSYQIKLENRADLIGGDADERARTWVIMAETFDGTLLRNRIAQDLALEMGQTASRSEHVDLYYDGEYRGVYLLCEKVEVDEARVDVRDYDKLLEKWNDKVGQRDLEALNAAEDANAFGNLYTYVDGVVENGDPTSGGYLLEMEGRGVNLSDRCYFKTDDSTIFASKNPENASRNMMLYISEKLNRAWRTIANRGTDPDTGLTAEEAFDLESFARATLLHELSYNCDGFTYSSSFFVLPEGSERFEAGPVWDFDLAFRYRLDQPNEGAAGFKDQTGWMTAFYSTDAFLAHAKRVYLEEIEPLVSGVLLGEKEGEYLKPLDAYADEIAASAAMDARMWPVAKDGRFVYGESRAAELALLRKFLSQRNAWLRQAMQDMRPGEKHIPLWLDGRYGDAEEGMRILTCPWQEVAVGELYAEQLTEADEECYAVWQLEAYIMPPEGWDAEETTVSMNGQELQTEVQEDGTLRILVTFEDPSYRMVDYWGDDIGLVYDGEIYAANYPEIAAEYEDDPEGLMEYFCDEGMYEGHMGNAYFDPKVALELNSHLYHMFGEDWQMYYWDYIYYGHDEGWMKNQRERFVPAVEDAL